MKGKYPGSTEECALEMTVFLCDSDLEIGLMIKIMFFFFSFSHQSLTLGFLVLSVVSPLAQQGYL